MKADTTTVQQLKRFQLPTQDLKQLDFCGSRKATQVAAWVAELPLTRVNFVSGLLYTALQEAARLQTDASSRLQILEVLRPPTLQCVELLSRSFLNQPLILPDPAHKAATVAQALQKHLTNGYMVALRDSLTEETRRNQDRALACHRAVAGLGMLTLRAWQVYTPPPRQAWSELHAIYCLADTLDILRQRVEDPYPDHRGVATVEQAYARVLLLACARPSQLRQGEILETYRALETLSAHATLTRTLESAGAIFQVNLAGDSPPVYPSRLQQVAPEDRLNMDTSRVIVALREPPKPGTSPAYHLSPALTDHLLQAWGRESQRMNERRPSNNQMEVTLGLSGVHYHLSGNTPFSEFLAGANLTEEIDDDAFGSLFGFRNSNSHRQNEQDDSNDDFPVYTVPLVDTGPGGHCIEWRDHIPPQVKAGELIGLRDKKRLKKWSVGVIRWVQQTRNGTQMGVQMLTNHASPLGAAVVYNTGGYSEYLRGLETGNARQRALITNSVTFREYGRARLYRPDGSETTVQLSRRLFSSGAISQFALDDAGEESGTDSS